MVDYNQKVPFLCFIKVSSSELLPHQNLCSISFLKIECFFLKCIFWEKRDFVKNRIQVSLFALGDHAHSPLYTTGNLIYALWMCLMSWFEHEKITQVVSRSSAGTCGFRGTRRGKPYAIQISAANAIHTMIDHGLQQAKVLIKGSGLR